MKKAFKKGVKAKSPAKKKISARRKCLNSAMEDFERDKAGNIVTDDKELRSTLLHVWRMAVSTERARAARQSSKEFQERIARVQKSRAEQEAFEEKIILNPTLQ